ncbi:uncharacterized protein BDV14DRAFT_198414 [Aspergillus stella-maris]|uniref:uncharacterized protein n=1 Tax=Aspergillus stella-maris TaxID=1810926 RepID=UPI003CCD1FAE
MDVSVFFFGLFLGFFIFTMECVIRQTIHIWKRTHSLTHAYLWMIWLESLVNLLFASTTRMQLDGVIKPGLAYYITAVTLWAFQTQLLSQIIANRIALIMVSKRKSHQLRWTLFLAIGTINLAVAFIWIPAHLDSATPFRKRLNIIFEHVEKSFFLLVDLGLNFYFLYLVRYRLIAEGLSKYWTLYKFNVGFVGVSTVMDGFLLGLLSLPDQFAYVQFAPVTYTVKLYLELQMAQLISKVVKRKINRVDGLGSSSNDRSGVQFRMSQRHPDAQTQPQTYHAAVWSRKKPDTVMDGDDDDSYALEDHHVQGTVDASTLDNGSTDIQVENEVDNPSPGKNIVKTITTIVKSERREDWDARASSPEVV